MRPPRKPTRSDRRPAPPRKSKRAGDGDEKLSGEKPRRKPPIARRPAARSKPAGPGAPGAPQRIAKLLARAGIGSRRDIERMIADGRVSIRGEALTSPALNVTSLAGITVDGKSVAPAADTRLFRFHKPPGCLTTARDPKGRPTIYDLLPKDLPRLVPVGRLDMNTEGLLLLTNDGELKRAMELPSSALARRYRVRVFGAVRASALDALIDGITVAGVRYGPINAAIERKSGQYSWLAVELTEGKNREVRKVLEHLGLKVARLIRLGYGPFALSDLPVRAVDEVPAEAVGRLRDRLTRA